MFITTLCICAALCGGIVWWILRAQEPALLTPADSLTRARTKSQGKFYAVPKLTRVWHQLRQAVGRWPYEHVQKPLAAVIIEPRRHSHLLQVVQLFRQRLGEDVPFYFFHGTENAHMLDTVPQVKYKPLGVSNLSRREYAWLKTSPQLYQTCGATHLLMFETDTLPISASKFQIQNFLSFDYVGAAWSEPIQVQLNQHVMHLEVGNGGLSLRSRPAMLQTLETFPYATTQFKIFFQERWRHSYQEDIFVSAALTATHHQVAPRTVANQFSFEMVKGPDIPWGVHQYTPVHLWEHLTEEEKALFPHGDPTTITMEETAHDRVLETRSLTSSPKNVSVRKEKIELIEPVDLPWPTNEIHS